MALKVELHNPITRNLKIATAVATEVVDAVLEYESAEAQNDMRENAPWQDRTGNARQGLFAQAYVAGSEHGMVLYHTVPYGIFLETRWSGRYEIIMPVVERTGRRVMKSMKVIMAAGTGKPPARGTRPSG